MLSNLKCGNPKCVCANDPAFKTPPEPQYAVPSVGIAASPDLLPIPVKHWSSALDEMIAEKAVAITAQTPLLDWEFLKGLEDKIKPYYQNKLYGSWNGGINVAGNTSTCTQVYPPPQYDDPSNPYAPHFICLETLEGFRKMVEIDPTAQNYYKGMYLCMINGQTVEFYQVSSYLYKQKYAPPYSMMDYYYGQPKPSV